MYTLLVGRYKAHSEQHQSRSVKIDVSDLEFLVIDEADKMVAEPDNCGVFKAIQKESVSSRRPRAHTKTFYNSRNVQPYFSRQLLFLDCQHFMMLKTLMSFVMVVSD